MRRRVLLAVASITILAGCASYPPGHMENGFYIDGNHAFQLAVPSNWKPVDVLPVRYHPESRQSRIHSPATIAGRKRKYPHEYEDSTDPYIWQFGLFSDAVFVNDTNTGAIILKVATFGTDLRTLTQQEVKRQMESFFADEQRGASFASSVSDYTYTVSPHAITDEPTFLAQANFIQKNASNHFPCEKMCYSFVHKNRLHALVVGLISEGSAFEENLIVLEEMTKTLKRYTPPPSDGSHTQTTVIQ